MPRRQTHRAHFLRTLAICETNACGHYGPDARGNVGCAIKPGCTHCLDAYLYTGGGCFADPPQFGPAIVSADAAEDFR